jgi:peptide/nickel transport system substrate-binding protein
MEGGNFMQKVLLALLIVSFLVPKITSGALKEKLVIAQGVELIHLDPARQSSVAELNVSAAVFDRLFLFDVQGNSVPRLALSHRIVNETTWEFKLRRGVRFHNGDPFTAVDVKFSFERYLDPKTKSTSAPILRHIKEVKIIDDYTVQFITEKPDPILIKRFSVIAHIFPSKHIKEKGEEHFMKQPIGTGPFKFVEWVKNDRLVLEANEEYWGGSPLVKTVVFRPIPEDATRMAELQTGGVDIAVNIPPFLVNQVKAMPGIDVQSVPGGRVVYLFLNAFAPGPLQDKKVRQALNYAVDKKAIIDKILMGSGFETGTITTPCQFGHDQTIKPYPYDPEKAKSLLSEAGYRDLKLVLNTPTGRMTLDKQIAEAVVGMFEKVGIKMDFRVKEWGDFMKDVMAKKVYMGYVGWPNTTYDADSPFFNLFTKGPIFSFYEDPEMKNWIIEARSTMDQNKRKELYSKISKKVYEEAPVVLLYQTQDHYGVSRKVKNFQARGDEYFFLYRVGIEK